MAHRGIVAGVAVLVLLSSVPLFMIANKNFLPQRRPVGVRDQPARARGHEPRVDRGASPTASPARSAARCPKSTTRWSRSPATRRKTRNLAHDLRAPDADRAARSAISSRSWTTSATRSCRRSPSDLRTSVQPVADDRRRRLAERRRPVRDQRTRSEEARDAQQAARRQGEGDPGRRRRRHVAERRQAGAVGAASIGRRRPTSACRSATPPRRCACWSAATR